MNIYLILEQRNSLPQTFSAMKKLATALLTLFGSSYACEQLFSAMNFVKSTVRNRLGSDLSASCVLLKTTCYEPNINGMANKIQQQISH
jgi:hypothetical protein